MDMPKETGKSLSIFLASLLLSALVLSGCGSNSKSASSSTLPAATVDISVSPSAAAPGQSATLTWSSSNATGCSGLGAWTGAQQSSGSMNVMMQGTTAQTYTLLCTGTTGLVSK